MTIGKLEKNEQFLVGKYLRDAISLNKKKGTKGKKKEMKQQNEM